MKDGLKIYACSGLNLLQGVGTAKEDFNYWLDNTETIHNTCAVNGLLAEINLLFAQLQYDSSLTDDEVVGALNLIDLYVVCLQFAKQQLSDSELIRAGKIIAGMVDNEEFKFDSWDNTERDHNLDALIATADTLFHAGENPQAEGAFFDWYLENVVAQNYVGLTTAQQERAAAALKEQAEQVNGVGAVAADASKYLTDSGSYYLYLYMTDKAAKQTTENIKWKRGQQTKVYNYCNKAYAPMYGGADKVNKVLYTGFMSKFKKTPEDVVGAFTNDGGKNQIGAISMAVATLVSAILSFVLGALTLILKFVAQVIEAKYTEPENAQFAVADGADIDEAEEYLSGKKNGSATDEDKIIKIGIFAAIAYFLFKK